jgi:hypothetical protein
MMNYLPDGCCGRTLVSLVFDLAWLQAHTELADLAMMEITKEGGLQTSCPQTPRSRPFDGRLSASQSGGVGAM